MSAPKSARPGPGAVEAVGHALLDAARGEGAERVHRGGVHVGLERDGGKVGAHRRGEDRAFGNRGLRGGEQRTGGGRERACAREEFAATDRHGILL